MCNVKFITEPAHIQCIFCFLKLLTTIRCGSANSINIK